MDLLRMDNPHTKYAGFMGKSTIHGCVIDDDVLLITFPLGSPLLRESIGKICSCFLGVPGANPK